MVVLGGREGGEREEDVVEEMDEPRVKVVSWRSKKRNRKEEDMVSYHGLKHERLGRPKGELRERGDGGGLKRTSVVVTSNLLHILRLGVHDDLGSEGEEHVFEEIQGKVEASEIVSVLEDLEDVAWRRTRKKEGTSA